jgi:hypothetical protein
MSNVLPLMGLHLHYRLGIAEMNSDFSVLGIFDDYLAELSSIKNEPEVKAGINNFQEQFIVLRKEIDELKHEMHLQNMKLAEYSREGKSLDYQTYREENHNPLEERYLRFRKDFDKLKTEFSQFQSTWLD